MAKLPIWLDFCMQYVLILLSQSQRANFLLVTGMVYPAFGVVYSKGIEGFSQTDPRDRRHAGDRNALWLFLIAIISSFTIGFQNYLYAKAASTLTARLRTLGFKAILRQDIEFFDKDTNSASI